MKWKFIIFIDLDGLGCIETSWDAAWKHEIFIQQSKAWILNIKNFQLKNFFLLLNDGQITIIQEPDKLFFLTSRYFILL